MEKASRGFSLVEAIIAATVLALAAAFALNLLPASALSARRAQQRVTAANLAQSLLEAKRARPELDVGSALYDVVPLDHLEFRRELTVEAVPGSGGAPLPQTHRVRVRVSWSDGAQQVVRETIIGRRP